MSEMVDWDGFEVPHISSSGMTAESYYQNFKDFRDFVKKIPKRELIERGWIQHSKDMKSLVPLFNDFCSSRCKSLYRKSDSSNATLCAMWTSRVVSLASMIIGSNRIADFKGLEKSQLKEISKLSRDTNNIRVLPDILAKLGIVLVYEKFLSGMKLDGMVCRLETGHLVIGISFRYPRIDNFWFTLMHELAHIHLHLHLLASPIFDDFESEETNQDDIEIEANNLAKISFIERYQWKNYKQKYESKSEDVIKFADSLGIHPAIVAGRLQKEENKFGMYRDIVDAFDVRKEIFDD